MPPTQARSCSQKHDALARSGRDMWHIHPIMTPLYHLPCAAMAISDAYLPSHKRLSHKQVPDRPDIPAAMYTSARTPQCPWLGFQNGATNVVLVQGIPPSLGHLFDSRQAGHMYVADQVPDLSSGEPAGLIRLRELRVSPMMRFEAHG